MSNMPSSLPNYTGVFRLEGAEQPRRVMKRNRQPASCQPCRARKSKCDRHQPCGNCSKRREEGSCTFVPNGAAQAQQPIPRQEVQARLQRLEEMVNGLVRTNGRAGPFRTPQSASGQSESPRHPASPLPEDPDPDPDPDPGTKTGGHLSSRGAEISFVGATHWEAVLESIHDIQGYIDMDHKGAVEAKALIPDESDSTPDLLFGTVERPSMQDILAALPPRAVTDQLLTIHFTAKFSSSPILHIGQFQRIYEAFWEQPSSAGLLWISTLFSALSIAAQIATDRGDLVMATGSVPPISALVTKAAQCLVAGGYLKARPNSVEALVLFGLSRLLINRESDPVLCSLWGVAARLAQRMGYHRDPAQLAGRLTAFEGEMRRRAWFLVQTFDMLISFQLGVPAIVHEDECDAAHPRNLADADFDEASPELPPERPFTDPTPMLYYCYKSRLATLHRRVVRHALAVRRPAHAATRALHDDLHALRRQAPPSLRPRPLRAAGLDDPGYLLVQRATLELMFLSSLCMLHRAYLTDGRDEPAFAPERRACRDAALRILALQAEFDEAMRPGARLHGEGHLASSLTQHQFLLAAMILCLDLNEPTAESMENRDEKLEALRTTYRLCSERSKTSRDAAHGARVLGAMLRKVSGPGHVNGHNRAPCLPARTISDTPATNLKAGGDEASMPLFDDASDYDLTLAEFPPLDNFFTDPVDLDWNMVDDYLLDRAGNFNNSMS